AEPGSQGGRRACHDLRSALGVTAEFIEHQSPDVRAELAIEPARELERAPALGVAGGIQGRVREAPLQGGDDRGGIRDTYTIELEDRKRHGPPAREPRSERDVQARQGRAALVRDPLVLERPARLLAEVR